MGIISLSTVISASVGKQKRGLVFEFRDIIGHALSDHFGWAAVQERAPDRLILSAANEPQRIPGASLKITVQPGDVFGHFSGERNEFTVMGSFAAADDVNGNTGTECYAISLYTPTNFGQPSGWCIPMQLHGPDNAPGNVGGPAFQIDIGCLQPGRYTAHMIGGNYTNLIRTNIDLGPVQYDQWVDFAFLIKWAIDNTGSVASWTRVNKIGQLAQRKTDNSGIIPVTYAPNLQASNGIAQNHYWKRGCYRSPELFTTQFFASPITRALTFEDAAQGSFG